MAFQVKLSPRICIKEGIKKKKIAKSLLLAHAMQSQRKMLIFITFNEDRDQTHKNCAEGKENMCEAVT